MLSTHDMIDYLLARRIGETFYIEASCADPVLCQAEADGYAVREGDKWRGLGHIQPGERRILRHMDVTGGDVEEIVG